MRGPVSSGPLISTLSAERYAARLVRSAGAAKVHREREQPSCWVRRMAQDRRSASLPTIGHFCDCHHAMLADDPSALEFGDFFRVRRAPAGVHRLKAGRCAAAQVLWAAVPFRPASGPSSRRQASGANDPSKPRRIFKGCRYDYVGLRVGISAIAADLLQCPSRQSRVIAAIALFGCWTA